ncbi:MAG: amino acid adenylation domain-containing protein [Flavobacteriales bacterium]|nr:amino acid adenylation domain-containing protein [Flavobacteriales bacterium]
MNEREIIELLLRARNQKVDIKYAGEQLELILPKGQKIDKELLLLIKENKQSLIQYLSKNQLVKNELPPIIKTRHPSHIPLSYSQERLWFIDKLEGSVQYHIPTVLDFEGNADIEALEWSIRQIIDRHEVLRTTIEEHEGQGYQRINTSGLWELEYEEHGSKAKDLDKRTISFVSRPFDLSSDYMLRVKVIRTAKEKYRLIAVFHHIASDGWSTSVLVRELVELYNSRLKGERPKLKPLEIQYSDYSIWQRKYLTGENLEHKLEYWQKKLSGLEPLELPLDYARPSAQSVRGDMVSLRIGKELTASIRRFSTVHGVSMFMTLLSGFKVLLYRYSGQEDICIGTPVAGRHQKETEDLIGFFINTLALRSEVRGELKFTELLESVKQTTLEAYSHQDAPFEKIIDRVVKNRDLSRSPLFQVMMVYQKSTDTDLLQLNDLKLFRRPSDQSVSKFELTLGVNENIDDLTLNLNFNTDLFKKNTVVRILSHMQKLLSGIMMDPGLRLLEYPLLEDKDVKELSSFNNTDFHFPKNKTVIDIFREQVVKTPDHSALIFNKEELSYQDFDRITDGLAVYLLKRGIKNGDFVPLCIERSFEMLIGIFAILKCGAAYVPIDPEYPEERIRFMLEDVSAPLILSGESTKDLIKDMGSLVILKKLASDLIQENEPKTIRYPEIHDLAYVIYTSGSTGKPKGVMNNHEGLFNRLMWAQMYFQLEESQRVLQKTTFSFDVSVWELIWPLMFGATLVIARPSGHKDADYLKSEIESSKIELLHFVPSMLEVFLLNLNKGECSGLKKVLCSGEALIPSQVKLFQQVLPGAELYNLYGPTEAAIDVTCYKIENPDLPKVPIGKPVSNTKIYIVDALKRQQPVGIPGELCIGGLQVAQGYLNREELTAEKFIRDPFGPSTYSKMYLTGDKARWLSDGNIEYLGRLDQQVKVRGFRIELGEIESVLQLHDSVKQAVVNVFTDKQGTGRLTGYVVLKNKTEDWQQVLMVYLGKKLPEYMIPGFWVEMDSLPLTPNGKIDKRSLPEVDVEGQLSGGYVAAQTSIQHKLVEIWQDLLSRHKIGIEDNFFELGGHSLLAMRVIASIRRELKTELGVRDLFTHSTIRSLSSYIETLGDQTLLPLIQKTKRPKRIPLSYSQERLWFIDKLEGSVQYHIPTVLDFEGKISHDSLGRSIKQILDRHEVLRTTIAEHEGQGYQQVQSSEAWEAEYDDLGNGSEELELLTAAFVRRPFDLSSDYMLRVKVIRTGKDKYRLIAVLHHIASDGWSTSVLVRELVQIYNSHLKGETPELVPIEIQYADYSIWQRRYISGDLLGRKLSYWKEKLRGVMPIELPTDKLRPSYLSADGAVVHFEINEQTTFGLRELSNKMGVTMFMTLLAGFKVLLHKYTNSQQDICVGTPIAGRQHKETENLIGYFINTLALRTQVESSNTFTGLLEEVRTSTLEAFEHQEVPFEKVIDAVVKDRDLSRSPLFQVMFVYQNTPEIPELKLGDGILKRKATTFKTTKFDLTLNISESQNGIKASIEYKTDLYVSPSIKRMAEHFRVLLGSIVSHADKKISGLNILSSEELNILSSFNDQTYSYPDNKTIVELFEQQVKKTPNQTALIYEQKRMSYEELNERSNRLAHYLIRQGVTKDTLVPLCMERGPEMIVAILGILKSGGAYVPIDPQYPQQRIDYMLKDTGAKKVLGSRLTLEQTGIKGGIASDGLDLSDQDTENPKRRSSPQSAAYVIYTSGSTGQPKGVVVEHRNLMAYMLNDRTNYVDSEVKNTGTFVHLSPTFDASLTALLMPLIKGSSMVLSTANSTEVFTDGNLMKYAPYDFIKLTPLHLGLLEEVYERMGDRQLTARLVLGGEALQGQHLGYLKERKAEVEIINEYGPTETTIGVSTLSMKLKDMELYKKITIGKPISNTSIYILDPQGNPQPIGVPGELFIGGPQVARGYLNREDLTKERFLKDPFSEKKGARMYKTGDLGRWTEEGEIEYLGRLDDQVKIRGYRIELGEIESALEKTGRITASVVLAKKDQTGTNRLVGYVVKKKGSTKENIQKALEKLLPEYMIPQWWVELESIPLTPNGKVDKKALPEVDVEGLRSGSYVKAETPTQEALVKIWEDLLGVEKIGIEDNFFELGGHSLLAMRVIASIRRELKTELGVRDLFTHSTIKGLSSYIETLGDQTLLPPIQKTKRPKRIPLSYSQERLWFIDKLEGSVQYHIPSVLNLRGTLELEKLVLSIQGVLQRHESLRTVIVEDGGQGYQQILPWEGWQLSRSKASNTKEGIGAQISREISRPFDLSKDYMLRCLLIEHSKDHHRLVVTLHHISSDGWSSSILVKEVAEMYNSLCEGREAELAPLEVQYSDYSIWQRKYVSGEVLEKKLRYWREQLKGVAPLELPTDKLRPKLQGTTGKSERFELDQQTTAGLRKLSTQTGSTMFMTLLSAFTVLLHKYTNSQQDICVGTPIAGRQHKETEDLIGFFINTLAIRTQVDKQKSFKELLEGVRKTTMEAYEHQEVPFEKVIDAVVKDRDLSRSPLFQVMFVYQNTPEVPELKLGGLKLTRESSPYQATKFELTLNVQETPDKLNVSLEYKTDLFNSSTIKRMVGHFTTLVASILQQPRKKIQELNILSPEEQKQIRSFNQTEATYPKDKTIVELFEQQVKKTPNQTALIYEQKRMSYEELNRRSNRLAHYLIKQGVTKDTLIPLCMERSMEMIVAILGILKSGGAYVPIDPQYPQQRIDYMLKDTGAKKVLGSRLTLEQTGIKRGIDTDGLDLSDQDTENPKRRSSPQSAAYVIYTSGSTGQPKGVMNNHDGLYNRLMWAQQYFKLKPGQKVLQKTTYSFDVSVWELIWPLLTGASIVIARPGGHKDSDYLIDIIEKQKITLLHFVPSMLEVFLHNLGEGKCKDLKKVLCSGEALLPSQVTLFKSKLPFAELYNLYGPTEAAIDVTCCEIEDFYQNRVTIGKPVSNTSIYILDPQGISQPIGVPGELYIGGVQVARGYLNREDLTKERFLKDPFSEKKGARMYKTGDLGRWTEEGEIEYLGRLDDQVKIRGYRIELGEIESVLQLCEEVQQAVVISGKDKQGTGRLIAYVVLKTTSKDWKQTLEKYLHKNLPEYMVPALWVELESIPLTPNGKLDRKALPEVDLEGMRRVEYVKSETPTQEALVKIWEDLLEVEKIGIEDNFFELGGHSLLAMRVIASIRRELKTELGVRDLFTHSTIKGLSSYIETLGDQTLLPPIQKTKRPKRIPLSYSQERLWFIDKLEGSVQYHIPTVLELSGDLSVEVLIRSIHRILERHEVLRTTIQNHEGQGYQEIQGAERWKLEHEKFNSSPGDLEELTSNYIYRPFDLSKDYMLRVKLIETGKKKHRLIAVFHHIASDGWSTSVLVKELVFFYNSWIKGEEPALEPLEIQYSDYSIWQRRHLEGEVLENKLKYWQDKLRGVEALELPTDHPRPSIQSVKGDTVSMLIGKELTKELRALSMRNAASMFMTLLSAFKVLLYRYSGQEDICVGTPVAGRQQKETENLIGFFINTLALRSRLDGEKTFTALLKDVKQTTLEAYSHQDAPFEKIIDRVVKSRDLSRSPLFQVLMVYQNTPEIPEIQLDGLVYKGANAKNTISKFEITLGVNEIGEEIYLTANYCTDLFKRSTISRFLIHFEMLLKEITVNSELKISDLKFITSKDLSLLNRFNGPKKEYPDKSVLDLFRAQAIKSPLDIALIHESNNMTFGQLDVLSDGLAAYINQKIKGTENPIPVCLHRGFEMIISILGILKSGNTYVPIDPEYPEDRIGFMIKDLNAEIIISSLSASSKIAGPSTLILMEDIYAELESYSSRFVQPILSNSSTSHIIYTSGSTGQPKGVMIEHRNLNSFLHWCMDEFRDSEFECAYAVTSMCFDLSVFEFFFPLIVGRKIRILNSGLDVPKYIHKDKNVLLNCVPMLVESLFRAEVDLKNIRVLNMAGEPISEYVRMNLIHLDAEIRNLYGPTEDTTYSTVYRIDPDKKILIGKPITNTEVRILDLQNNLLPVGLKGEICLTGAGLSRGYWNRPELNREKFVPDVFGEVPDERMYRTGDLGRWLEDGNIEYLGRMDQQVKIRGYRIELGEIESALQAIKSISNVVVMATENSEGTKQLVAYVVLKKDPENTWQKDLEVQLSKTLPEYMIPRIWIELDNLPLTPNGKVDRKKLPEPDLSLNAGKVYSAPRTPTEEKIATIWQRILEMDPISVTDDFFELGGNSLIALRIVSALLNEMDLEVDVISVIRNPTIESLAIEIDKMLKRGVSN